MEYTSILFAKENGIGEIVINRPKALNALNGIVMDELSSLLDEVVVMDDVKVVILTGSGDKSFVAGADIAQMSTMNAEEGKNWGEKGQNLFLKLEQFPKPIIAAINGFALGGGCEIAMASDIRIASEKAKFGQPEVTLGIIPGFGGTQRLPRLVGKGMAKLLIYTGDMIDAQEALRIGLVQKVVQAENLLSEARGIAQRIIARSATAVGLAKVAINRGLDMAIADSMQYEALAFGLCFAGDDQQEGMAAFLEKRKPNFTGCFKKG